MSTFLSHNKADKEVAREIAMFLAAEDVTVWFDEWEIAAGDSIVEKIDEGLTDCSHFLILWSEHAAKSNWVRRELQSALAKAISDGKPRVIPVCLDNSPLPSLLADIRYIRYRGGKEADREELVRAVTGHGPSTTYIRAIVKKYREVVTKPERTETFGLAACPKCGSEQIEPWTDWEVDVDGGDFGEPVYSGYEIPAVRCSECGWESRGEGMDLFDNSAGEKPKS